MLWVPIPRCALHYDRRNRAQPPDDLSRLVKPSYMSIAGRQNPVGHRKGRRQVERGQQVCRRLLEPAAEEIGLAYNIQMSCHATAWAKPQIVLKMLDRDIGLAGKDPKQSAPVPTAGMARVERETT